MHLQLPTFEDVQAAQARIQGLVRETPVLRSEALNRLAGATLFIKAECLQETGSFKLRGASNRLMQMDEAQREAGVVAFSSGNHAQGIARAAKRLGMPAIIVMPSDAPDVKIAGVRADGADIYLYERDSENREEIAARLAEERGAVLVPSFDDPDIIAGQGTCGIEFAAQMRAINTNLDALICCTGGGGLISGIRLAFEHLSPKTEIWAAEPDGHDDWRRSLQADEIRANPPGTRSICDAILTPQPGALTWALGRRLLSGGIAVTDAQVQQAMAAGFAQLKVVAEPGGAAALAAALFARPDHLQGRNVGIVMTGGNVDAAVFTEALRVSSLS